MKYLRLGYNIFCRNIILNLILILQLSVALILVNMVLGQVNAYKITSDLFENLLTEKGVYYMPSMPGIFPEEGRVREDVASGLTHVKTSAGVYQFYFYSESNADLSIPAMAIDRLLADKLRYPLKKGVWPTDAGATEGIPVVVSSEKHGFQVGRTVSVAARQGLGGKSKVSLKVAGVLRSPVYALNFNRSGNVVSSGDVFAQYDEERYDVPLLIFCIDDLGRDTDLYYTANINSLIFFQEGIGQEDIEANLAFLRNRGYAETLDVMYANGRKDIKTNITSFLPFIISILSISLIGLVSLNLLNTILHMKVFAVYYICGSRWKNCFLVIVSYMFIIFYISLLLVAGMYYYLRCSNAFHHLGLQLALNNILVSVGLYALVMSLAAVAPWFILTAAYPQEIIRRQV